MAIEVAMSKWEMNVRSGLIEKLWWKFMPGTIIKVKWPKNEWVTVHTWSDGSVEQKCTNDPNYHYRPWLEKNAGKQGIDWNWKIAPWPEDSALYIKFRKGKEQWSSVAGLLWN